MDVLVGPLAALGVVLVVSGVLKLIDTAPTEAMLGALNIPKSAPVVWVVALIEIVVGVMAVVFGGRLASALVGVCFAAFAGVSLALLSRGERSISCGCFGRSSATISPLHVAVDAVAVVFAVGATIVGVSNWFDIRADLPAGGIPELALIGLVAALTIAVLTVLPEALQAARRQPAASSASGSASARRSSAVRSFGITEAQS